MRRRCWPGKRSFAKYKAVHIRDKIKNILNGRIPLGMFFKLHSAIVNPCWMTLFVSERIYDSESGRLISPNTMKSPGKPKASVCWIEKVCFPGKRRFAAKKRFNSPKSKEKEGSFFLTSASTLRTTSSACALSFVVIGRGINIMEACSVLFALFILLDNV